MIWHSLDGQVIRASDYFWIIALESKKYGNPSALKAEKVGLSDITDDRFGFQSRKSTFWLSKPNYLSRLAIGLGLGEG